MKRFAFLLLWMALGVSLWFNWRSRGGTAPARVVPASATLEKSTPVMPPTIGEIDFSGTGFADDSWKLDSAGPGEKIPDELPKPGTLETPPSIPAEPPAGNWNLEESQQFQLTPGKNP